MGDEKLLSSLVRHGKITEEKAQEALKSARNIKQPITSFLVENKILTSAEIKDFIEQNCAFTYYSSVELASEDPNVVSEKFKEEKDAIFKYHALPLIIKGNTLFVATPNTFNDEATQYFATKFSMLTDKLLVDEKEFQQFLTNIFGMFKPLMPTGDADVALLEGSNDNDDDNSAALNTSSDEDEAPIVKYVNQILADAVRQKVSDLHFEPYEKRYRVRFRIDGVLHEVSSTSITQATKISARIKIMSRLDIAERRIPQDGRIKIAVPMVENGRAFNKIIDLRVNTLPTLWGEKIVMRILDSSAANLDIDKLGFEDEQKKLYLEALAQPQGMILVTGPTGSGKTVSLYTGLRILNTVESNISTAEDPVEINLEGINQVQINTKAGLTFASALRAFLRQDPDIVMVGEIRDLETAEIAIKAAQTGHLVLSTLHTNSAPETLTRLLNMGVPSYNIASSVTLIIAQRLGRRLCEKCKIPEHYTEQQLLEIGYTQEDIKNGFTIYTANPDGCEECNNRGYKGRVGIYEIFKMSPTLAQIIMEGGNSLEIAAQAEKEGMVPLRKSGLRKVAQGVTSLKEVFSVTQG